MKRTKGIKFYRRLSAAILLLSLSVVFSLPFRVSAQSAIDDRQNCVLDRCTLLERGPLIVARAIPYAIIVLLLLLALHYSRQILRTYQQYRVYRKGISRIINTKKTLNSYLAITTQHLSGPASIMMGGINLLESLERIPKQKLTAIKKLVLDLQASASQLASANQVSASKTVSDKSVFSAKIKNPIKHQDVMVPIVIAFFVLLVANIVFVFAGVYNKSPIRIAIEFGYVGLSALVVLILFRYLEIVRRNKNMAIRQLAVESRHYQRRADFIEQISAEMNRYSRLISEQVALLDKTPETRLLTNGLQTLQEIGKGFTSLKIYANFTDTPPLFNVTAYAKRVVNQYTSVAVKKEVTIRTDIRNGVVSRIQPEEIGQIIDTLLNNAVKFSHSGDKVQLTLRARFGRMTIEVRDEGEGISEERLPSILSPFKGTGDSMQYNYEGAGLNLYLCKVITDKFGGEILIESKVGQGTKVVAMLPIFRTAESIEAVFVRSEVSYKE